MSAQSGLIPLLIFLLLHFVTGIFLPPSLPAAPPLFAFVRNFAAGIDRRLNREMRPKRDLALRGALTTLFFLVLAIIAGRAAQGVQVYPKDWIVALVVLFFTVALMQPLNTLRAITKALIAKDLATASRLLQRHVAVPLDKADSFTIARHALEWSALSLHMWFTGPLFWFALLGPRGAILYATVAALRVSLAANDMRHVYFGIAARWIDNILSFLPSLLTVVGLAFAAIFVRGGGPVRALTTFFRRGRNYPRGIGEWPVAALAGALGVTLGGPPYDWIGPAGSTAKVTTDDLVRGALLHFVFFLCAMAMLSTALLARYFFHI